MKNTLFLVCSIAIVSFSYCKKEDKNFTQNVTGTEATIGWQDCASYTDQGVTLCFEGANEYRCPCNADCIWEGAIDAKLHVKLDNGLDTTIVLTTNSNPVNLHTTDTIAGKIIRFVGTNVSDCNDYGKYEKYKVTISVK